VADNLDVTAVARRSRIGDDYAVRGLLLFANTGESDSEQLLLLL
jgi:hypothetical protein